MGRKRRMVKKTEDGEKPLPDADPNSEEFIFDEVEKFHRNKDKIMLDTEKEAEEESEDEESDPEEVLGVEESSVSGESDEEDEEDDKMDDSDLDNSQEKELPSDKAWGKSKKIFYDADVEDADIYASDEEAEIAAQEEEIEALSLQKRMAERLDEDDFLTIDKEEDADEVKDEQYSKVTKDLSKLSKRQKLELVNKESPELLPLINEYQQCMKELKDYYSPLLKKTQKGDIKPRQYALFIQTKHQLLMNYLVNISFYLALKADKEDLKSHPIVDVLRQHKQLLSEAIPMHDTIIQKFYPEDEREVGTSELNIKKMVAKTRNTDKKSNIEKGKAGITAVKSKKSQKLEKEIGKEGEPSSHDSDSEESEVEECDNDDSDDVDPLTYYNELKHQTELRKKMNAGLDEPEGDEEEVEEFDENGKRKITYEMAKNRGLKRHRRKELRNPRVKHKMKFKKAKIKRKGQVREVQNELSRYGGELTGIKSNLTRSVRIK